MRKQQVVLDLPPSSELYLNPKAIGTAKVILFFDRLFNSCNESSIRAPPGKNHLAAASSISEHILYWQSAKDILKSMYFTIHPEKRIIMHSIQNWIYTHQSFKYKSKNLESAGFRYFFYRSFNQDLLENL